ncbi:MAG TPA: hypothetical protein PKD86_05800 [Gemmatales bacterium]|mgnify:FL=1|nr:hypothetical protein [Gemmatales bacterium]
MRHLRLVLLAVAGLVLARPAAAQPVDFMAGWVPHASMASNGYYGLGGVSDIAFTFGQLQISWVNHGPVTPMPASVVNTSAKLEPVIVTMGGGGPSVGTDPHLQGDGLFLFGINSFHAGGFTMSLPDGEAVFNVHWGTGGVQTGVDPVTTGGDPQSFPAVEVGPNAITLLGEVQLVSNTSTTDLSPFSGPDGGLIAITFFSDHPMDDAMDMLINGGSFKGSGAIQLIGFGPGGNVGQQIPEPAALALWASVGLGVAWRLRRRLARS